MFSTLLEINLEAFGPFGNFVEDPPQQALNNQHDESY